MSKHTSNQTPYLPGVHTGSGAYFDTAHFTGGGHAFGSNSTVHNISGYARLYEIRGDTVINNITDVNELKKIQSIVNLPRAQAGRKDYETKKKGGSCFPGTREALLQEIMDWVAYLDESLAKMYALSGLAGTGKSTIAYTVAAKADERDILGASFFFSRDEADRRNAKNFFTTIAYQLCLFNEEFAQAIARALVTERGTAATVGSPEEQLQALILNPLEAIITPMPRIVIVVDALDECDDGDVPSVLMGLRQLVQTLPWFKVILTTRPQPLVDNDFASQEGYKIFHLHNIKDQVVNKDIRLYLKYSLSREQVRAQLQDPTEQWCASDTEVESLVQAAGKLFIIASMVVRFILDKTWSDPADKMEELLRAFAQNHTPFDNLREFYTIILRKAVPADCCDPRVVERYQVVVGTILLTLVPLSINTIAVLTGVKVKQVSAVLRQLRSIVLVDSDNVPTFYHKSFFDYITDSTRCKDVDLRIVRRIRHTWIASRCFEIMDKHLRYNILGFGNLARFMNNEDGLAKGGISNEKLQRMIPPELQYACIHWADHFDSADIEDANLMKELEAFAEVHALHWFETLSLIGKLDSAHPAISAVLKVMDPTALDLRQLLSDQLRFISKFYNIIRQSALHTYYTAFVFTPTDSLLYHRYIDGVIRNIPHLIGRPDKRNPLVAYLKQEEAIRNIRFSPDGTMLVSWSEEDNWTQGLLNIWDVATGTSISMIRGSSFGIANDFSTVASIKNNTITLYDVNGSNQGATFTSGLPILQVAISSESCRIAAIVSSKPLCLWDSEDGELVDSLGEFPGYYLGQHRDYLQFSPTGVRLAYVSGNGVVKLCHGIDGRLIADLDCGSLSYIEISHLNLSGHNFSNVKFSHVKFSHIKLSDSNFSHAQFFHVNFTHVDCSRCNFSDPEFSHVNFFQVYFSRCNFSDPQFSHVNVFQVNCSRCNFWSPQFSHVNFLQVNVNSSHCVYFNAKFRQFEPSDGHTSNTIFSIIQISDVELLPNKQATAVSWSIEPSCTEFLPIGSPSIQFSPIKFSADGSRIATLSVVHDLKLWSCDDGELVGIAKNPGSDLAISNNGSLLATRDDMKVKLWSGNSGNPLPLVEVLDLDLDRNSFSMSFSPSDTLAIATKPNIKIYNIESCSFISTLSLIGNPQVPMAFSQECTCFAAKNWGDTVHVWNIVDNEVSSPSSNIQASGQVTALALSLDCSRVACGFWDGAIELWGTGHRLAKQRIAAHKYHSVKIETLGFSPDGTCCVSSSGDGTINLWGGEDGAPCGTLQYPIAAGRLYAVEVSNSVLAAAGNGGIVLWNCKTLRHIHTFKGYFRTALSFSADGVLLATVRVADLDDNGSGDDVPDDDDNASDGDASDDASDGDASFRSFSADGVLAIGRVADLDDNGLGDNVSDNDNGSDGDDSDGDASFKTALSFSADGAPLATVRVADSDDNGSGDDVPDDDDAFDDNASDGDTSDGDASFRTALSFSADEILLATFHVADSNDNGSDGDASDDDPPDVNVNAFDDRDDTASHQIILFDVTKHTSIAQFDVRGQDICAMTFLPDNSQLVVQLYSGRLFTFNLIEKNAAQGPAFEHLMQLHSFPLWHGVPVWMAKDEDQYYLRALFSQHDEPVSVLWIPRELRVRECTQGRSMFALSCKDGGVVLLRLPISRIV